ncbi:hypothetical protein [Gracilimonas sp.]|uniref:hypothetical protein n=1 Tax=Gracilimonas sp. TaxID=1974203 RepID=UPI003BACBD1F
MSIVSCNLLTVDEEASDYPTTFPAIEFSELDQMNQEYQAANNGHICSTLNKYGFTGYSEIFFESGESPCANREVVRIEIEQTDTLITAAKAALLKNSTYTGVNDTSKLIITELLPIRGCTICEGPGLNNVPIELKITFAEQEVDSNEVIGADITVVVDAEGVNRIWGNWYSDFEAPGFVNYGYEEVQSGMIGWQIDMRPFTGEESIYTVQENDISGKPERVYLPIENESEQQLEIRTCWAIPISYSQGPDFEGWIAYVDIEEGFLVDLRTR